MRAVDAWSRGGWQGIASILLFLGLWQVVSGFADSRLFPGPVSVLQSMVSEARDGALLYHLGITLARVGVSFAVAMVIGVALGIALGRLPWLDRWFHPWLVILLNVPALVVIILTYIWLGLVETALLVADGLNKIPHVGGTLPGGGPGVVADYPVGAPVYPLGPW